MSLKDQRGTMPMSVSSWAQHPHALRKLWEQAASLQMHPSKNSPFLCVLTPRPRTPTCFHREQQTRSPKHLGVIWVPSSQDILCCFNTMGFSRL